MSKPQEVIVEELVAVLLEFHKLITEEQGNEFVDTELVTGVDFVCTYEVRVIDDESVGGYPYTVLGNQNITTTLGLGHRMNVHLSELLEESRNPEDD